MASSVTDKGTESEKRSEVSKQTNNIIEINFIFELEREYVKIG